MSDILISVENNICKIGFNRPEKKNALTHSMYDIAGKAIEQAQTDENIRAILIYGVGDDFTAGNDVADFANPENTKSLSENVRFMQALLRCKLPVVAQVQGRAIGIGATLLLHCDIAICDSDASFVMPFVHLGLVPEFASSYLLPKLAGHRKASKWLMLGEPLTATDAEDAGLVSEVVERTRLEDTVADVCKNLAMSSKLAMHHTKALMKSEQNEIELHMNGELDIFSDLLSSPDAQKAFSRFLKKNA